MFLCCLISLRVKCPNHTNMAIEKAKMPKVISVTESSNGCRYFIYPPIIFTFLKVT